MKRDVQGGRPHHGFTPGTCAVEPGCPLVGIWSPLALETTVFLGARVRDAHAGRRTEPSVLWGWSSWSARMLK